MTTVKIVLRGADKESGGSVKKFIADRPFADPDAAARKIVEIANDVDAVQNGRIYIERVNAPFLAAGGSGDDFRVRHRARLVMAARERHLHEVHQCRRCSICPNRPRYGSSARSPSGVISYLPSRTISQPDLTISSPVCNEQTG
jgi:hypothetical protein